MARNIRTLVGYGREVVAQGSVVLAGGDVVATVALDDLSYAFEFRPSMLAPSVRTSLTGTKHTTIAIEGAIEPSGNIWFLERAGMYEGGTLSLAMFVQTFSSNPSLPTAHLLQYTFSKTPPQNMLRQ